MKMPKYILRVAGSEFAVPESADLQRKEIELSYSDRDEDEYRGILLYLQKVVITKIPPGVHWKRKLKNGTTQTIRPVPLDDRKKPAPPKRPALRGREPLQLEFGT